MIILGLTGSMAMGKSTVAKLFKKHGVPVISADDIVHELYAGRAAPLIEAVFSGTTDDKGVDRQKLMTKIHRSPDALKKLEAIIHPLVREEEWAFIEQQKKNQCEMMMLEIPLLFETGAEVMMDAVIVASAAAPIQRERAMERPGMTDEKFKALLANQMPDTEKRARADYIVNTGTSLEETEAEVQKLIKELKNQITARAYETWKNQY